MYSAAAGQPGARPAPRRPRLGAADIALYLWRAKWLMLLVFLPLFAVGLLTAISLPVRYTAETRFIAESTGDWASRISQSHSAGRVPSELDLIASPPVVHAALEAFGVARLYPAIAAACDARDCQAQFTRAVLRDFQVSAAPGSLVIRAAYRNSDPVLAEGFLGALIAAYTDYRAGVLEAGLTPEEFEDAYLRLQSEVSEAEAAIRNYAGGSGQDSPWADENLQPLMARVSGERLTNAARLSEVQGQLSAHRRQLRSIPEEHDLFVDDLSEQRLQELYIEREEWRARLSPDSAILRDLDRRIERAELFLSRRDEPAGMRRRGVNPLYQELQAQVLRLEAEAEALARQQAELDQQWAALEQRRTQTGSTPADLARLIRRRDVAAGALDALTQRDAAARLDAELAGDNSAIRMLQPPSPTHRGDGLRIFGAVAAFAIAALAALAAGLAYASSRRGFATASGVEQTLDLPVLASVPLRKGGAG